MRKTINLTGLLSLVCALSFILSSCSPVYEHMPDSTEPEQTFDPTEEYFTQGEVVCGSSANLGIIYEGQWVYVEAANHNAAGNNPERLVKYNPVTNTVSSLCLNPTCLHSSEECLLCAPNTWMITYFDIFGDWIMYTFANYWSNDDEEIDTKRTYLYNLKTGESRELHARSKEGMLLSKTTTNYVMDGKIYATRLELDYTGEEEFNSSPHEGEFVPETRQFIEVYDPETQEVERICEIPNYYLLVGLTNKRFFFKDKDGVTWSSNHKGENITEEKNMDFDFIMVCGKYLYPPEEFDYKKVGYNIRGYDLETDSSFPIDFGMVINAALVDSGRLCFTTNSNIDEYKEFNKNSSEYVRKLYPEASERQEILNLKSKIRDKLLYSGTFQMYVTDARGENRKLVYEGEHMNFSPRRMFGNYIFGSVSYGDPNNDFRKINTPDDGRCVINLETGEITPIPYLDTITDNQQ